MGTDHSVQTLKMLFREMWILLKNNRSTQLYCTQTFLLGRVVRTLDVGLDDLEFWSPNDRASLFFCHQSPISHILDVLNTLSNLSKYSACHLRLSVCSEKYAIKVSSCEQRRGHLFKSAWHRFVTGQGLLIYSWVCGKYKDAISYHLVLP